MNKLILGMLGAAALGGATMAQAQVTLSAVVPGTNPYSGPTPTYDFDTNTPSTSGGAIVTGTFANNHAQPYGSTGNYYAVGPYDSSPGSIDLTGWSDISSLSFLWGSVDSYNTLQFIGRDGTTVLAQFTGNDIFNPANGNRTSPNTNPVVYFSLAGSDATNLGWLRLSSSINAFEIDDIAINPVPEPATWAMMILGFGAIGMAARRSRRKVALAQLA